MKRPVNKGARCQKWQRVPGRGGALRCAKYSRRGPFRIGYQRGHVPANRGKACKRRKLVYSPWYDKKVWRCADYGRGRAPAGLMFRKRRRLPPVAPPRSRPRRVPPTRRGPSLFQRVLGASGEGRVPLSLPSMERQRAGRT